MDTLPIIITNPQQIIDAPLVLYFSGDGGWKPFSKDLVREWAIKGMPSIGVNVKKYFSDRKIPTKVVADFAPILREQLQKWHKQKIVLAGFSFGASIIPFIENELPKDLKDRVVGLLLMSPTKTSDFETHYIDMLNMGKDAYDYKVFDAVKKIQKKPVVCVWGKNETAILAKDFKQSNVSIHYVAGHHDFEDAVGIIERSNQRFL